MRKSSPPGPVTVALDRGPAKYFHGRKKVLNDLCSVLPYASNNSWGTCFLIQGAPGAGKSALLHECGLHARAQGWVVADIDTRALWNSYDLLYALARAEKKMGRGKFMRFGLIDLFRRGYKSSRPEPTVENILRDGRKPLLLTLDEAQILGVANVIPSQHKATAIDTLQFIHNGELGRPVILLAAGLYGSKRGFAELAVERFVADCFVELGVMGKEAERAVIYDWLKKAGGAKGDPTVWINAIAQETHGWPQHIMAYVDPALKQLAADKGEMTTEGLNSVLEAGCRRRSEYYEGRARGIMYEYRQSFARVFANVPAGESVTGTAILAPLTQEYGREKARVLFRRALRNGVLHTQAGGFAVPVPSMQEWLVSNYGSPLS